MIQLFLIPIVCGIIGFIKGGDRGWGSQDDQLKGGCLGTIVGIILAVVIFLLIKLIKAAF